MHVVGVVSPGQSPDLTGALPFRRAPGLGARVPRVKRRYGSDEIRETLESRDIVPVLPTNRNRKSQIKAGDTIYALRNRDRRSMDQHAEGLPPLGDPL